MAPDTSKLYSILEVKKDATISQLKKSYYNLAKLWHPDKHPNDEEALKKFQEISHAYDILSDPEKKELYDKFGEEGLQGGPTDPSDFLKHFFTGGSFRKGPQKGEDIVFNLGVTLKEFYNGITKKLRVKKKINCDKCKGKGCKENFIPKPCFGCDGNGIKMTMKQIGPGMVQQIQSKCTECQGKGEIIDSKDQCENCKGKKTVDKEQIIEVFVEKGMKEGQRITFSGEGDQVPGIAPGDIVIILKSKSCETPFQRSDEDLILIKKINLLESLTGFEFKVDHLDDRVLLVKTKPGEVTSPNQIRVINHEGMPKYKNPFSKGNLYIKFEVQFPSSNSLTPTQIDLLTKVLPAKNLVGEIPMDHEEYFAEEFDESKYNKTRSKEGRQEAYDEEDEDHSRPQTCYTQ